MKYVSHFVGIIFIGAIFCLLAYAEKDFVLVNVIEPPAGVTLPQWLDIFYRWSNLCIAVSVATSLVWYAIAQWGINNNSWTASGKRVIWSLLFIPTVICIVLGLFFTKYAQEGSWIAYLFYIIDGSLCYYLATALFSPSSFKYTPLWADQWVPRIRRWDFQIQHRAGRQI